MKKQILFMLTGLMLAVGAWAVIYEATGTDLQVWVKNRIVYTAKVTEIDSIATQETSDAKKIRMWVNKAIAYEVDVRGIDSITFAETVEPVEPDTLPTVNPDTISGTGTRLQVWVKNKIVYVAKVRDIDSIATEQTADANMIRVWVNRAVAYEANVAGIDSITFAATVEPVNPDTIPVIDPDTIPVIIPDTTKVDSITPIIPDTIPVVNPDTIPTDTIPVVDCPEGALPGLFSVSADKRVYFSKGNLQYVGTWQFAEHQWDYFGTDQSDGHRDLFGWGTGFTPNMVSTSGTDYWAFVDWGENAISNGGNKENLWQTLTQPEFTYLFFTRENADSLFGLATVNGIKGLIVLPDNWTLPAGATFVVSTPQDLLDYGCTYKYNSNSNKFSNNTYTAEQWAVMERAGAVFLPAAGWRSNKTNVLNVGSYGYYWSATPHVSNNSSANCLYFTTEYLKTANTGARNYGRSVRLVQPEILPDTVQKNIIRHKFSVAESKEVYFSPGNLQYRASTDTWRFAEHQYDTIGAANANISDTYDGWIDLFGWGTGDKPTMSIQDHEYYFYCYHDWGMNHISYPGDTIEHQWRALTSEEWTYLYNNRPNCTHLSGYGKINGVAGYIILPDDWKPREGIEFVGRASSATNTYSLEQWERMEALGAIFLPHAGMRDGTEVNSQRGRYWLSSIEMTFEGCARSLETNSIGIKNATNTWYGYSVRLIEPVVPEVAPPDPEPIAHPEGAVAGLFSVSETKKVYFSQGNLQYNAGVWRFAEHQYDTIGADNQYIGSANMDWIDLFGWGTGDRPWETSTNTSDYLDSYVDWGVNPISNAGNTPNMWYTMTKDEWEYVFNGRPNAIELRGNGRVNGVAGYIFLPDDWQLPYGGRFFPNRGRYLSNVYNLEEWARMEAAGAVFLPNAGKRRGTEVSAGGGHYWSSTKIEAYRTVGYFLVGVSEKAGATVTSSTPDYAKSVRLVQIAH